MTDDTDLKNSASEHEATSDRTERGDRAERGEERSGGRRDRSREMLREELVRNLDDTTRRSGRPRDWEPADRPARQAREATAAEGSPGASVSDVGGTGADAAIDTSSPPARWKKEAKAEWANLPKTVQEEFARGEANYERGVQPLKQKLAELGEVEQALAPHLPTIQKFGHRPGAAVSQLFSWFQALSTRPDEAFPALMQSFNYNPRRLAQVTGLGGGAQQQQALTAEQQYNQAAVQAVQRMIDEGIGRHVGPIQQQFESQRQAQTEEILANWAKGKKHYEKVRGMMSRLLMPHPTTGESIVPLKNGAVDLDSAYAESLKLVPEVWAEVQAAERAAERKAESERAQRARYSSSSLRPASPGSGSSTAPKKRGGMKTVRDSINDALLEIRDA
jgi:hypothetical protein